jgi:hypothetical protein
MGEFKPFVPNCFPVILELELTLSKLYCLRSTFAYPLIYHYYCHVHNAGVDSV